MIRRLIISATVTFAVLGICSCRTHKVVISEKETTTVTVHQRKVPVFTPQKKVSAQGKIWIDPDGFPKLGEIKVTSDSEKPQHKKPDVSVKLDSLGNLDIDVVIPEDTVSVVVSDTTKSTVSESTSFVEVEKDNPWWKKALMWLGSFAFIIIISILGKVIIKR